MKKEVRTPKITYKEIISGVWLFSAVQVAHLSIVELEGVPFQDVLNAIKRYYIWAPQEINKVFGEHAHNEGVEIFHLLTGEVEISIESCEGVVRLTLSKSGDCLFIPTMVWHSIKATKPGTSVLVSSNVLYDRVHYIEDKEVFKRMIL